MLSINKMCRRILGPPPPPFIAIIFPRTGAVFQPALYRKLEALAPISSASTPCTRFDVACMHFAKAKGASDSLLGGGEAGSPFPAAGQGAAGGPSQACSCLEPGARKGLTLCICTVGAGWLAAEETAQQGMDMHKRHDPCARYDTLALKIK